MGVEREGAGKEWVKRGREQVENGCREGGSR
jgi:hypothetical protein